MKLTAEQRTAIAEGRKREHRLPAVDNTTTYHAAVLVDGQRQDKGEAWLARTNAPPVGTVLALGQRRRAVVIEIEESVTLTEPTRTIAKAEGYGNRADAVLALKRGWLTAHDAAWMLDHQDATAETIATRYTAEHVGRRIHILHLEPAEAFDEFMGHQGREDYVDSPATAIDPLPVPPREFVQALAKAAEPEGVALRDARGQGPAARARRDLARAPWRKGQAA